MTIIDHQPQRTDIAELPAISLYDLNTLAALQTRVDRKYVIETEQLAPLVHSLAQTSSVLEIEGRRTFAYQSIYFDTPDRVCYHAARTGRRRRFKVRSRTYVDSGLCMLEVKVRGTSDVTVKHRIPHEPALRHSLSDETRQFIASLIARPEDISKLEPVLITEYDRTTLVDRATNSRITIDSNLESYDFETNRVRLDGKIVVESKSCGRSNAADLWLWRSGTRPAKLSKFATSCAALDPSLPSNKWTRTLSQHFAATIRPPVVL